MRILHVKGIAERIPSCEEVFGLLSDAISEGRITELESERAFNCEQARALLLEAGILQMRRAA